MKINGRKLWVFAILVTMLALVCASFLWADRMSAESNYKSVQMIVNYDDIVAFANAKNTSVDEVSEDMQNRGVSVALFKEEGIEDLARAGKISVDMGSNVKNKDFYNKLATQMDVNDTTVYVSFLDKTLEKQAVENILLKCNGAKYYEGEVGCVAISSMLPSSAMELSAVLTRVNQIGVGFDMAEVNKANELGFKILPQVRSWSDASDKSLKFVMENIKSMPNLYAIAFNDKEVVGYSESLRTVNDLLKDSEGKSIAPLASIEFSEQKGFNTLAMLLNKDVVRLHTISNAEMTQYANIADAMDRWMLGVREREMRALFVRFFDIYNPVDSYDYNMEYLQTLNDELVANGFSVGDEYKQIDSVGTNGILILLCGLGVASGLMMLLLKMGLNKLSVVAFLLTCICWGGLYVVSPIMARKLMALASVIIYATLGCVVFMKDKRYGIFECIGRVVGMSAVSFLGAIFMVGVLADALFMMKLDWFIGVKIAHIVPILAVPFILYIYNGGLINNLKELLNMAMTYKWVFLGLIMAVAGVIYIMRTGNTGAEISSVESGMRDGLNDLLGVRPRSKEFLIGYPFAFILFYLGASKKNWILTLPVIIGQVSLVNTYAHIHTPILISLQRSFNGLVLGSIIGLICILVLNIFIKIWRKWV